MSLREHCQLNLVLQWDEAQAFMSWLGERRPVLAVDTETSGVQWWHDRLRMVQFGDCETGWAIPWEMWGGLASEALRLYTGPVIYHNAKFDVRFLERAGAPVRRNNAHDTAVLAHLVDPGGLVGLKACGVRYVDAGLDQGQTDLKKVMAAKKWNWGNIPIDYEPYWVYAALDAVITANLHEVLRPKVTGRLDAVYELEMACEFIVLDMECRGARVDLEYCHRKQEELDQYVVEVKQWAQETYDINLGSTKQLAAAFQRDGIVLRKKNDSGAYSMDEAVLAQLVLEHQHPLAAEALSMRRATKMSHSYFQNFIDLADGDRVHPDVKLLGARTGRMSVVNPALQTLPREALVRNAFIPSEGNRLLSIDYDQVEFRLFTHFCQDPGLIEAFAQEGDFFTNMARRIYGDDTIQKADPRRQITKSASYAKIYGAGPPKFAATAGIPEAQAIAFLAAYDAQYPGVRTFQHQLENLARRREAEEGRAYVCSPLGRVHPADRDRSYALMNYLVQGTAADVLKLKLVELDRAGLTDRMILPVHDEVIFDVPAEDVEEFKAAAVGVLENLDEYVVPLTVGADVLERWGDKYA